MHLSDKNPSIENRINSIIDQINQKYITNNIDVEKWQNIIEDFPKHQKTPLHQIKNRILIL